ncbi:uncharacterized protein [Scyliorhinus torazame]|uniref:uncharacterized protein isoform X2 n=1 Tax=Scyliorhinus torazame TaxID=75743 RepID=UPI003B5C308F
MRYKIYWLLKCQLFYCVFSSWNPVFGQIRYSIPEELQLGAFVGNIADDLGLDIKQLSARSFRIVPGPRKQYVDINLDSGFLFVKETIDREEICGPRLSCVISLDCLLENPLKLHQVSVEILDVNDNAPSFQKNGFGLEISELSTPGTRFPLESAHDSDIGTNSLQTYELLQNDYFILDVQVRNGVEILPVLVLQSSLDREAESSHMLTLIAKDGGVPVRSGMAQVSVIVKDANDNAPVFPQSVYRVTLLETTPAGTGVIILNATDLDNGPNGEITYSFSGHTSARARELFEVDSKTGEIILKGQLDYEEVKTFGFNIQAMDKGSEAMFGHCDVLVDIIDVNDNVPEVTLTSLSSTVSEDAPVGTVVALFSATDKDSGSNGQVQCQISKKLPFQLDSSVKNYYELLVQYPLDRENASHYDVTITCTDAGNPPLTSRKTIRVEVSDMNDNVPRFTQSLYTANVMENNFIGTSILSITAFDPDVQQNARLKYSILETQVQNPSASTYISINSETGVLVAHRSFDYEKLKNFQVQAQVMDSGTPPLASNVSVKVIILDQNDNVPVIVHPLADYGSTVTETMPRFAEPGYLVAKVSATDADTGQNARLSYSIFQATQHNLFTISADTGEIWTIRRIENKDLSEQRLVIVVKDNGTPSLSATVTIVLSVVGGDTEAFSSVNESSEDPGFTPDLSLSLVIALGVVSIIFLVILVILAVKVHQSRNTIGGQYCPLGVCCCFERRHSLNGIQKASTNLQMPPNYVEVFGGDPLSQSFRYEPCSTLHSTKRDFITANTCRSSTDKNYVRNESMRNENPGMINSQHYSNPVHTEIRYSIPEELQLGAVVGNIAEDLGFDINQLSARSFRFVPGPRKQYVDINLNSGFLFVKETIDREEICGPRLSCVISLDCLLENPFKLHQVSVEILDVNDNAPSFPKKRFRLEVSEISTPGMRFPLESADDPDIGTNSLQTYELLPNDYFIVDVQMRNGVDKLPVLVLQSSLDREAESSHVLTLIAKDGGVPVRSGTAQVSVIVKDANDNAPVFPQSVYRVTLLETAPTGTRVIILNATDLDEGPNGEITYSLSSHTSARAREMFEVDSKTGEIRLKGKLDYEENRSIGVNIQAMEKGPDAMSGHCDVLVDIIDVNDNAPEVTVRTLSGTISEGAPVGTLVALFSATDKDSGRNAQIQCEIEKKLPFKLNSYLKNYYELLVQHQLDRENASQYDVTISCTDAGNPPLTSRKTIRVEVSDINDNVPRFTQSLYTANVMENNVIGASIFSMTAFDPDVGQYARLKYSILETQVQNASVSTYISINSETGVIFAQRSFDYEKLKYFQFQAHVMDSGTPPHASNVTVNVIILDQNDNVPVIVHPLADYGSTVTETISRFAEPGYLVAKVSATDADASQNALLSYSIFQATQPNLFTISPDTGEIWAIRRIVNKDASQQRLMIVVKDNGTPSLSATVTIILSVIGGDTETFSSVSVPSEDPGYKPDLSLSLVMALGVISTIFLVILIILAVKVHQSRNGSHYCSLGVCCCFGTRHSPNGIQKSSRKLEIPPNYVEIFGGDPLSQSFRYESCSTLQSTKRNFITPNTHRAATDKNYIRNESMRKENPGRNNSENYNNPSNTEVKQPNADWHFAQTHRAELSSAQYLEEEGVQREIQREVQREVQCDVQREVPRDVQCDVPRNIQREVQRDVQCDMQRVVEKDPGGPRKPMCARPVAIPAGRDGWTLPRTAPRMQLQMTLGAHVPGTLRSQYLIPREIIEATPVRVAGGQSWTPRLAVKFPVHQQANDYLHNVYIPGTTTTLSGKSTTEREGKKSFITFGKKKKSGK